MPTRRIAWAALVASIATLSAPTSGSGVTPPEAEPQTLVTLGKGRAWGSPWRLVAYRTGNELWCEAVVRDQITSACLGRRPEPDPLLVTAAFHKEGPRPTTFAVISTDREVAHIRLKLVPGDETIARRVHPLPEGARRRAGLPHGYRYLVIALEKVRGLRSIDAFDEGGDLIAHNDGVRAPKSAPSR